MTAPRPSRPATSLCQAVTAAAHDGRTTRRRALNGLRRAWLRVGDPATTLELGGVELLVPLSHELPLHQAQHPDYSQNLGRVAAAVSHARPGATVVDIGGNVGDSAAIIRAACTAPVLCVEGDAHFLPYLDANAARLADVEVERSYVAAGGRAPATVVRSGGTARLVAAEADDPDGTVPVATLDDVLGRHPRFARPALVKVDTDGQDVGILTDAADVLRALQPVLFFEFDPALTVDRDAWGVFGLLRDLGYGRALLYANTGELLADRTADEWSQGALEPLIDPAGGVAYLDVCAVASHDLDIAEAVAAGECEDRRTAPAARTDRDAQAETSS